MIRTLVVEDEQSAAKDLMGLLKMYDNIEVIGHASNLTEANNMIKSERPQLVFLDIELGDRNSVEWLQNIDEISFSIIFVTGHNAYAVEAFRFSAIDYLLKPVSPEQLDQAIRKIEERKSSPFDLNLLSTNISGTQPKKLMLSDADNVYLVDIRDIIHCQASNNYTIFFLIENKQLVISKPLKEYVDLLENQGFFRIHKTHLINLQYFIRYSKQDGGMVVLKNNIELPVAVRRKEALLSILKTMT